MAWIGAAGVFVVACAFHATYAFHGLSDYDEGILLDGAARVLRGETYGGDFQAPYGPGRYYALAGWWRLFGSSVATYRGLTVLLQSLAGALLFRMAARHGAWSGALCCAAMLAVAHGSLFKSFLLLTIVLVLYAAFLVDGARDAGRDAGRGGGRSRGRERGRWLGAGALAGLACVFRYDVGVFGLIAVALGAVHATTGMQGAPPGPGGPGEPGEPTRRARLAWLAVGCAVPPALAGALLVAAGASPFEWWRQTRVFLGAQMRIRPENPGLWGADGLAPLEHWLLWGEIALSAACCVGQLAGVLSRRLRGARLDGDSFRLAVAVFGLALFNQLRLMVTLNRMFQVAAPTYVLLADLLARRGRPAAARAALVALTLGLVAWVHLGTQGLHPGSYTARNADFVPLELERAGVRVAPATARNLGALVDTIHAHVAEGGSLGIVLRPQVVAYLADRSLALPFAAACFYLTDEAAQREAIGHLERSRPELFVEDPRPIMWFTLEADAPLVHAWIREHYEVLRSIGPYTVWRRRP